MPCHHRLPISPPRDATDVPTPANTGAVGPRICAAGSAAMLVLGAALMGLRLTAQAPHVEA